MPGLSLGDLENKVEGIASACWARDARIERHKSNASLVRVDVIRRDPLTGGGVLPSVLVPAGTTVRDVDGDSVNDRAGDQVGTDQMGLSLRDRLHLPRTVIDLTDTPTTTGTNGSKAVVRPSQSGRSGSGNQGSSTNGSNGGSTTDNGSAVRPVKGRGGEDISDYL